MTDWSLCCKAIIKPDSFDWPRCAACGRIVREMVRDGITIREGGVPVSELVAHEDDVPAPAPVPRTWSAWKQAHEDQERRADLVAVRRYRWLDNGKAWTWDAWRKAHPDPERAADQAGNGQAIEVGR